MLGLTQPGFKEKITVSKGPPLTFVQIGLMNFDLICVHSNSVPGSNDRWSVLTSTPQSAPRLRRRWSGPCAAPSLTGQAFWRLLPCAAQYHANLGPGNCNNDRKRSAANELQRFQRRKIQQQHVLQHLLGLGQIRTLSPNYFRALRCAEHGAHKLYHKLVRLKCF